MGTKKRIIKKYEQLDESILKLIHERFPDGFEDDLISFQSPKGELELALPFEVNNISYLIQMPKNNIPEPEESDPLASSESSNFESLDAAENIADEG